MNYLLKVWISTMIGAPVLFVIFSAADTGKIGHAPEIIGFLFFAIVFGIMLSTPTLILFLLLSFIIRDRIKSALMQKIYYLSISLACMLITIRIFFGSESSALSMDDDYGGQTFMLIYGFCILLFGSIYMINETVESH